MDKIHKSPGSIVTIYQLALFATLLAFVVVVLGAYTRLTDAGLGCPDWPGCYGQLLPKSSAAVIDPKMDPKKAWTEMTHRYAAGLLGILIFTLGILSIRNQRDPHYPLILPLTLMGVVVFQALLGMWTVTLKLLPIIVVAHLLGGLTTLSLVWWLTLRLKPRLKPILQPDALSHSLPQPKTNALKPIRILAWVALIVLGLQLFLGGWTSANYAALVCLDFPACQQGQFFPVVEPLIEKEPFKFLDAFNLIKPLNHTARITIHMLHRINAVFTALVLGWLSFQVYVYQRRSNPTLRALSIILAILLLIQILLGITNVLAVLSLPIATAHNAIAALLLLTLVTLNYYLHAPSQHPAQHR